METSNLQELINKTGAALTDAGATRYYQRVFKQVSKQLLIYSQDMKADSFCVDLGLQFLEAYYSMAKRVSEHSWPVNHTMRTVRYYLKYCYENGFSNQELFSKIPNIYYNRQSRLPSSYSSGEVDTLLKSIDVGNPCGKRDYAIILLISRLGLRSSDVANLRFSNIDWENDVIRLIQRKTGTPIELPLLEDVGGAIINYLKNARPEILSKERRLQLTWLPCLAALQPIYIIK